MDASLAPAWRAETVETTGSFQGHAATASAVPAGMPKTTVTIGSSQVGAVDASSAPKGRAESDPSAASASHTDQGNGEDPPVVLSGRALHQLQRASERGWEYLGGYLLDDGGYNGHDG